MSQFLRQGRDCLLSLTLVILKTCTCRAYWQSIYNAIYKNARKCVLNIVDNIKFSNTSLILSDFFFSSSLFDHIDIFILTYFSCIKFKLSDKTLYTVEQLQQQLSLSSLLKSQKPRLYLPCSSVKIRSLMLCSS